jgi:AraC-like DNA-binding protein
LIYDKIYSMSTKTFKNTDIIVSCINAVVFVDIQKPELARFFKNRKYHGLVYQLDGCSDFFIHNETFRVNPNSLLYLPKGYDYHVKTLKPGKCIAINFTTVDELNLKCNVYNFANHNIFHDLFVKINHGWLYKKDAYIPKCLSLLYEIIYLISQNLLKTYYPNEKSLRLLPAISFIENNYNDYELKVPLLAGIASMSVSSFRKYFNDVYNTSPIQYINILRINHAKDLLSSGYYSITEISELVGYSNVYYFSKVFKQKTGLSPRDYRNKYIL